MTLDRRRYRRLNAPLYWRGAGLRSAWKGVDVSLGGIRIYSDDVFEIGTRIELELLAAGDETIEFNARVVWVDVLPAGAPALYDVGLEFLELSDGAKRHLEALLAE